MIPARPTTYRGIQMRSRLEAQYARLMDTDEMPTEWIYEPRAFGGLGGQYLPDFEILGMPFPMYVEVKPTLERAYAVMSQMTVIWESEPKARLVVIVKEGGCAFSASSGSRTFRLVGRMDWLG